MHTTVLVSQESPSQSPDIDDPLARTVHYVEYFIFFQVDDQHKLQILLSRKEDIPVYTIPTWRHRSCIFVSGLNIKVHGANLLRSFIPAEVSDLEVQFLPLGGGSIESGEIQGAYSDGARGYNIGFAQMSTRNVLNPFGTSWIFRTPRNVPVVAQWMNVDQIRPSDLDVVAGKVLRWIADEFRRVLSSWNRLREYVPQLDVLSEKLR